MNKQIVCRSDDFDFRMDTSQYIAVHEEFIKNDLIETAVLQFTTDGRLKNFQPDLIEYMNKAPNWDFAIHGWEHAKYNEMLTDFIVRDIAAACYFCETLFHKRPTMWYPPWNCWSIGMEQAAKIFNLTISNESYDIARFIREVESKHYEGHTVYFHSWKADEMLLFPKMINCLKELKNATAPEVQGLQ